MMNHEIEWNGLDARARRLVVLHAIRQIPMVQYDALDRAARNLLEAVVDPAHMHCIGRSTPCLYNRCPHRPRHPLRILDDICHDLDVSARLLASAGNGGLSAAVKRLRQQLSSILAFRNSGGSRCSDCHDGKGRQKNAGENGGR